MDEEKEELIKVLTKANATAYIDDLYDESYTVDDFIKDHPEYNKTVRGFREFASKDREINAPHNMTPEEANEYFEGNKKKIDQYFTQESKVQEKIEDKNKLAEEYVKGQEWSLKLPAGTPFVGGMELANPYAAKHASKGETGQAVTNEIAGKAAGILDFVPVFGLGAPAIRTMQKWAADEPVLTGETAVDWGLGALGAIKKIPGVRGAAEGLVKKFSGKLGSETTKSATGELLKGKGKIVKDLATNDIAYGSARKAALPGREEMDMPKEKDYQSALNTTMKIFGNDWKSNMNIPDENSPYVIQEAYRLWKESRGE